MNCHFVTKWITEKWEHEPGSLWYYDFSDKQIKRQFSKHLFAEDETNSKEIEGLLNKYIEAPLKKFTLSLNGEPTTITDWIIYRSIFLYFLIQAQRYAKTLGSKETQSQEEHRLDELLKKDEKLLDDIVTIDMAENVIISIVMPPGKILFFPETGFYQIPLTDPGCITNYTMAYVVPITPFIALARVSKTIDFEKTKMERSGFSTFSVGINDHMNRVLIPKLVREQHGDAAIKEMMETHRKAAINIITGVTQIRELVVKMYNIIGLSVGPRVQK